MVSFTECRLFGEGAAGSPVDGRGECMTFATAGSQTAGQPSGFVGSPVAGGSEWQ